MAKKSKQEHSKAASKNNDAAFFTYEEEKKDLGTLPPSKEPISNTKNVIYVFKDKTTTTVCYDGKDHNYITVNMNS